jgi:hypothetical protein
MRDCGHGVGGCTGWTTCHVFNFKHNPRSQLGKYFDLEGRNTVLSNELRAGCVAFLTVRRAGERRWTGPAPETLFGGRAKGGLARPRC